MKLSKIVALLILACLVFMACGAAEGQTTPLAIIDIANASNLFIASGSALGAKRMNRAVGDESKKLFKITDDGHIQEVTYIDEEGNEMTNVQTPSSVHNLNDTYVVICFDYSESYLTRKSDGAVFSLNQIGQPLAPSADYINASPIRQDSAGNIYYPAYPPKIIKIDTTNPNNLTGTTYVEIPNQPTTLYRYTISPQGNLVYTYTGNGVFVSVKKPNGGVINLPNTSYWIDIEGNINYQKDKSEKIGVINSDTYEESEIDRILDWSTSDSISPSQAYLLEFNNRIIVAPTYRNKLYELDNPQNAPRVISISGINNIIYADNSDNFYYLAGHNSSSQPVLLKVDPANDAVTSLLTPNQYDIYKMTVSQNDEVIFNALRMDDGKKVLGKISSSGELSIIDETMDEEVVSLERIR